MFSKRLRVVIAGRQIKKRNRRADKRERRKRTPRRQMPLFPEINLARRNQTARDQTESQNQTRCRIPTETRLPRAKGNEEKFPERRKVRQPIKKCARQKTAHQKSEGDLKSFAGEELPKFKRDVFHFVSNNAAFFFSADAQRLK